MASTSAKEQQPAPKPKIELAKSSVNDEGDECNRTFIFNNEDHTLGNSLKHIISKYPEVEFCSYNTPHPLEDLILFHIQTRRNAHVTAADMLRRGLMELEYVFRHLQLKFEEAIEEEKDSRTVNISI